MVIDYMMHYFRLDRVTWIGQNKRTGAIGSFPQSILVPSFPSNKGLSLNDEDAVKLIDFDNDKIGLTVRPAPGREGWVTFDSTIDLASSTGGATGLSKTVNNDKGRERIDVSLKNDKTLSAYNEKLPASRNKMADIRDSQVIDVSDSARLLPGSSSVVSLSEPCSPAHQPPDLRITSAAIDNLSFDPQDTTSICKSLPDVTPGRCRLSSASCDDISVGVGRQSSAAHHLFTGDLSKASSDSHVDGRSASAPPIPPRDYPKRVIPSLRTPATIPEVHPVKAHPVIHPIVQDGKQRSNTHYWLLPEKKGQPLKTPEFDPPPPPAHSMSSHSPYINMSDSEWREGAGRHPRSISGDAVLNPSSTTGCNPLSCISAATSETSMGEACEKIDQVRAHLGVESVTDEEIMTALSGHHWSVDLAIHYLKVEHLFRLGLASRQTCRAILDAHRWDLESAASALVDRCTGL